MPSNEVAEGQGRGERHETAQEDKPRLMSECQRTLTIEGCDKVPRHIKGKQPRR